METFVLYDSATAFENEQTLSHAIAISSNYRSQQFQRTRNISKRNCNAATVPSEMETLETRELKTNPISLTETFNKKKMFKTFPSAR